MRAAGGLLLFLSAAAAAQWPGDQEIPVVNYPALPKHAASLAAFVPTKWALEAKAIGDLNGDRLPDAALVLHMRDPRNRIHPSYDPHQRYDTNPRMLAVVFANRTGYDLAASDHTLIPRRENPNQDEPFGGVTISNGALHVKLSLFMSAGGWRMGSAAFTLRWQDGAMRLIGYDADWVQRNSGETEKASVNYLTRQKRLTTGSIENDDEQKTVRTMPKKPLLTLNQIGDGLMFEPGE